MEKGWKYWEGKKVFIVLKSGRRYSGIVLEVEKNSDSHFIIIKDKFDAHVGFNSSEIDVIQEESTRNGGVGK